LPRSLARSVGGRDIERAGSRILLGMRAMPGGAEHTVQFYDGPASLAHRVADFIAAGLTRGEAAIIIATAEHRRVIKLWNEPLGHHPFALMCGYPARQFSFGGSRLAQIVDAHTDVARTVAAAPA